MIGVISLSIGVAVAADGHLEALVGGRTAPDAALEQPTEWEPEIEPTLVTALVAGVQSAHREAWWGLEGSMWAVLPELDAALLAVGPRAGIGTDAGPARLELAARYDAQVYPWITSTSNGRAEGLLKGSVRAGRVEPEIRVEAIDREYPLEPEWSFRTVETGVGVGVRSAEEHFRARIAGSWQLNQGSTIDGTHATGDQLRATADLGWSTRRWESWTSYRIIRAREGAIPTTERAQFTPIGDYSADADALSTGGFWQHRLEIGGSAEIAEWTIRASALGRLRIADPPVDPAGLQEGLQSYGRTLHGQLDLERPLGERLSALTTIGFSGVLLDDGQAYTDVYGWVGLSWRFSKADARDDQ